MFELDDPAGALRITLERIYGWYRENQGMSQNIARDRLLLPALDHQASTTIDANLAALSAGLAAAFKPRGREAERLRLRIRVALEFWTWRRLSVEGLNDRAAAALMAEAATPCK